MKIADTLVNPGGLMRCCLESITDLPEETEVTDGQTFDCKYEETNNQRMILDGNTIRWNRPEALRTP